jgi:signal transduction histidine kinase
MADLNQVVHDTILLMKRQCEKQKVHILFEAATLPHFRFDPEKIKQGLLNIVRNALEAMQEGGTIHVITGSTGEYALLEISDNGPGIREEDLSQIFEPFFTCKGAGTGLGLSITQRIIEEHNGHIRVESTPEAETRFTIELPILINTSPMDGKS